MVFLWGFLGISLMFAVGDAIAGAVDDFVAENDQEDTEDTTENTPEDTRIIGTAMGDFLSGTDGDENLQGYDGDDALLGQGGDDTLYGNAGEDVLMGGAGADRMFGGTQADALSGGDGDDFLRGGAHMDLLFGDNGDDILKGDAANDMLVGGAGADTLQGGVGDDTLFSGSLENEFDVEDLRAVLNAAPADTQFDLGDTPKVAELDDGEIDNLFGGDGDDDLVLGATDVATGGEGSDYFFVLQPGDEDADERGVSEILDFNPAEDELILLANSEADPGDHSVELVFNDDGSQTVLLDGDAVARLSGDSIPATYAEISVVNPSVFLAA